MPVNIKLLIFSIRTSPLILHFSFYAMLSKGQLTLIRSLQQKKFRQQHGLFLVEGTKSVQEVLGSDFGVARLFCTDEFYKENAPGIDHQRPPVEFVTADELTRAGSLETNNAALALVQTRPNHRPAPQPGRWTLVLDDIRDPGNLGTILRVADWYGVRQVLCSETTTDVYAPKVISASKGSFTRVHCWYGDLAQYFSQTVSPEAGGAVYGAFLDGENVHRTGFDPAGGYIVLGNESNGIGPGVTQHVTHRLTIPRFGGAESLNVGIAAAVLLDNLRRQQPV
jgi:RNA methyltransferase, TrmH family